MAPAEILVPIINDMVREAHLNWAQIDAIAVTVGPGSFTGIRTGLSAAKGFVLAANCKVYAIGTLETLAFSILDPSDPRSILVINDARRNQVYFQEFNRFGTPSSSVKRCDVDEVPFDRVAECRLVGTGIKYLSKMNDQAATQVNNIAASHVGLTAQMRLDQGVHPVDNRELRPQYLRRPDARAGAGQPLVSLKD